MPVSRPGGAALRAAAYCRVSTDREDQANSLRSQQTFFKEYIGRHEGWTLAGVYADEGISGTSTRGREAFNRMMHDAEGGKLDLILTKEVSRFARNTVDTLEYTRRLKQSGIGVIFISDNIDTRDNDGELRLTIMASMAQEESRKTSERVKWGQKRRMEAGVVFGNDSTYGFTTAGGRLTVKPEEAEVVRSIYRKFLHEGKGAHVIARELYEEGVPPPRTSTGRWSCVMVRRVLRNEKYVGDLCQKKSVTIDFLTHRRVENRGREERVYLKDHHEAIVDRPVWEAAQAELAHRSARQGEGSKYSNRYWCSGKLRCGACGGRFVPRTTKRPGGTAYKAWECHSRVQYGNRKKNSRGETVGCGMRTVNDKALTACVQAVLERLGLDYAALASELSEEIRRLRESGGAAREKARLEERRADLMGRKERAMDACFRGAITGEELARMKARYDGELERLEALLQSRTEAGRLQAEEKARLDEGLGALLAGVTRSEEVYAETIEAVGVYEHYLEVWVRGLPQGFRVWYSTGGAGANYKTTIEKIELCGRPAVLP